MYDKLKKALHMNADDDLVVALTFYRGECDRDLDDPADFTLGIRRNGREVATIYGSVYHAYENNMTIDDFMQHMDDCCVDHGVAAYVAMKKVSQMESEQCLSAGNPDHIVYIREIDLDVKSAENGVRALILHSFDELWFDSLGYFPDVVTMLFSPFEEDIRCRVSEDNFVSAPDGQPCYVQINGLLDW